MGFIISEANYEFEQNRRPKPNKLKEKIGPYIYGQTEREAEV
jgi:hypothetical protein